MFKININGTDRAVYEKELKNFLPDRFIDCHTHIWLSSFTPYGQSNGGAEWTKLVCEDMSAEELLDAERALYPGKTVIPLVFGGVDHDVTQCNDYVRESKERFSFPALYRTDYRMDADELEENVKKGGFIGIKPYITNCPTYIPADEIRIFDYLPHEHLRAADRNGWIVMLHIPRSGRLRDGVNLAQLLEIEEKYPNLKLIVAHIGRAYSSRDLGDAFRLLKDTKNMMFDFTANLCDEAIEACIEAVDTKRLMFGSDLPISNMRMYRITEDGVYYNVVPRGLYGNVEGEPHMRESDSETITLMVYEQLRAFRRVSSKLHLHERDIDRIMYTNARDLILSRDPGAKV